MISDVRVENPIPLPFIHMIFEKWCHRPEHMLFGMMGVAGGFCLLLRVVEGCCWMSFGVFESHWEVLRVAGVVVQGVVRKIVGS